jgi:hypothetical protein
LAIRRREEVSALFRDAINRPNATSFVKAFNEALASQPIRRCEIGASGAYAAVAGVGNHCKGLLARFR